MASACVNNITMSPDRFPATTYPSYGWLSPRISFSREADPSKHPPLSSSDPPPSKDPPSPETQDPIDFEFRLEDPVAMLPADELFSDGKLMPLHVTNMKPSPSVDFLTEMTSPETAKACRSMEMEISGTDPYLFSPKAPRCSSRWKELLGLKKLYQNQKTETQTKTTWFLSSSNTNPKSSLKHFLQRSSKSCYCNSSSTATSLDHSLSLPLLKDSDCESVSISSSRLSLSSSSWSHDHEDLPRLSLDFEKPYMNAMDPNPFVLNRNPNQNPPRMKMAKPRSESNAANASSSNSNSSSSSSGRVGRTPTRRGAGESSSGSTSRGVSVDSPRMNSCGKIVFQSLERSSSSPSSFNGGPRFKHRGMERSYSANVRVTPVLNVPVSSLRGTSKSVSVFGFGQLFSSSPQKREPSSSSSAATNKTRNRTADRT